MVVRTQTGVPWRHPGRAVGAPPDPLHIYVVKIGGQRKALPVSPVSTRTPDHSVPHTFVQPSCCQSPTPRPGVADRDSGTSRWVEGVTAPTLLPDLVSALVRRAGLEPTTGNRPTDWNTPLWYLPCPWDLSSFPQLCTDTTAARAGAATGQQQAKQQQQQKNMETVQSQQKANTQGWQPQQAQQKQQRERVHVHVMEIPASEFANSLSHGRNDFVSWPQLCLKKLP